MSDQIAVPEIGADDFARRFALRSPNLIWFLGAGASAAAGIPTAMDMIWDFKQRLFVSQRRVAPESVADLSSPAVRAQLQAHIDSSELLPKKGDEDEYAALFEAVYPSEGDRRSYIDAKVRGGRPSYGHLALATLMRAGRCRQVWTTNFDPLIADACAAVFGGTGALTSVALDAPDLAAQTIREERWPVEIKLHGDFRSRRLKNTADELRQQDAVLRRLLVEQLARQGLVVAGYSARDDSIMSTLEDGLACDTPYPAGLFWLHRGERPPLPRAVNLLSRAAEVGVDAALVRIENFDETLRDLTRLLEDLDTTALDQFAVNRRRWTAAPRPSGNRGWPVLRLNALPVEQSPTVCRRVVCSLGGYSDIREALDRAAVNFPFARVQAGILCFGSDGDVRTAFEPYDVVEFDLHTLEERRLRYESGERGLLRESLARALVSSRGLRHTRRRSADLLAPADLSDEAWKPLRRVVGALSGTVSNFADLTWVEGVETRLDWADDRLWLLVEPRTVFDGITPENRAVAADFARERTVRRYNRQLNELVDFWAAHLAGTGDELRSLGVGDGIDAVFRLSRDTGFSRRAQP